MVKLLTLTENRFPDELVLFTTEMKSFEIGNIVNQQNVQSMV